MKIKNISDGPRGVNTLTGSVVLGPGEERDLELSAGEHKSANSTGWFEITGDSEPEEDVVEGYSISDAGRGWFNVKLDGKVVTKNMRAADLEGFEDMSSARKAAFVDEHKATQ